MKRLLSIKTILIAIAFTVFLLFLKDNISILFSILGTLLGILTPFIIGFLFAYILNFPYKLFYNTLFGKMGSKRKLFSHLRKPLSLICTYSIVFAVFVVIISIVVPQITVNLTNLFESMPIYFESMADSLSGVVSWINDTFNTNYDAHEILNNLYKNIVSFISIDNLSKFAGQTTQAIISFISATANGFYNFIMGIVISVYFLADKERLCLLVKRLAVAFLPIRWLPKIYEIVDITDTKCGRFLVGDILDAGFIGILTFVTMSIFQLPYAPLISVLIGVSNIIPFFGPFIGAIPSAVILFVIDPWDMIVFVIIVVIIQQLDGNIFKPKIIGNQVGLSSFWVLFSVILGGSLFGLVGFILGTPIYAVIYTLVGKRVRNNIKEKGKIAQEALDFEVLNYQKIAEEQKRLREEKENQQKEKLKKLIGINRHPSDDEESE